MNQQNKIFKFIFQVSWIKKNPLGYFFWIQLELITLGVNTFMLVKMFDTVRIFRNGEIEFINII